MKAGLWSKAALFNAEGKILLLRRSSTDDRRAGEWDFPGGHIEPGEDLTAGQLREIQEETGLTLSFDDLRVVYGATEFYDEGLSVTRLLYVGFVDTDDVRLSFEHDEFKWVDIDTALQEFPHPFYGVGLKYARDHGLLQQ